MEAAANDVGMEVDNGDNSGEYLVVPQPTIEQAHPLALVAISLENANIQIVDNPLYVDTANSGSSPTISTTSSRAPSPLNLEEESNQSESVTIEEPIVPSSNKRSFNEDDDDEGSLCPICLDNWTNTGDHRICSLKCGHLFGYKCVTRWLDSQTRKSCPTCKKKVGRTDIRYIYAKKLIAVDTTELEGVRQQLEFAIEDRSRVQMDLSKALCRESQLNLEINRLKCALNKVAQPISATNIYQPVRLYMDKSMEACKHNASRVFDVNSSLDLLMASMKSPMNLFSGFGLKKISITNYRTTAFIPVHTAQIRDICFHPENNWVLTASMDKTFKVIDNNTNVVTYQFNHQMPLWSCCWDLNNPFILYVGTQSGIVIKYDIRRLTEPINALAIQGDMSPVVAVASIPAVPGEALPQGGVVSCKLNSLWIYQNSGSEHIRHGVSLEGPFVSMKYQMHTKQLLVSSRPNSRNPFSRHTLCTMSRTGDKVDCDTIYSFQGGGMQKLLSKSCFLSHNNDYVAAHQENSRSVYLWSINTGEKVCSVPAHDTVLDLKGMQSQNGDFLVSLTEKKLEFFKFV